MKRALFRHTSDDIISIENLLEAWGEFLCGKRSRVDVQVFERNLMDNLLELHMILRDKTFTHGGYESFTVSDPKTRHIHKASVRDRVLHRAVYRKLYPFFDRLLIHDSYSCRNGKGAHKALKQFERYARRDSKNHRQTVWVLKCDIRKFFASIQQSTLIAILSDRIVDKQVVWLLERIICSFSSTDSGKGLPLGNLTSQVFANIYMNEFDQFVKHSLRVKCYIRYADDFVFLSEDRECLESILFFIQDFLIRILRLELHPKKIELCTVASGVDFLGWVHFPHHRVLRTVTKRRMFTRLGKGANKEQIASYKGLLSHGTAWKLRGRVSMFEAFEDE